MAYTYKYNPKGQNADAVRDWLTHQHSKAESLTLLILRAQKEYGNIDIADMVTNSFISGTTQAPQTPSTPAPTPKPTVSNQTVEQPKPTSVEPTPTTKPRKANLGMLSKH